MIIIEIFLCLNHLYDQGSISHANMHKAQRYHCRVQAIKAANQCHPPFSGQIKKINLYQKRNVIGDNGGIETLRRLINLDL